MRSILPRPGVHVLALGAALTAAACSDSTGPRPPSELVFAVTPVSVGLGEIVSPPLAVAIRDDQGNTVLDWTEAVTLTLEGGPQGVDLLGTVSQTPLAGLAVFDDLEVTAIGAGYRLRASSGNLTQGVSEPFDINGVFQAAFMSAGAYHTCALTSDGAAYCWGRNLEGQLGLGGTDDRFIPTPVNTSLRFASLSAFANHTCGLSTDATVYCWGDNRDGAVGDGTTEDRTLPTPVPLPGPAASVDAGNRHTCALLEDGQAYCWGDNLGGALGIGVADTLRAEPVLVSGSHDWAIIETGYMQSCGLTTAGVAYCWGPNIYGENGVGERFGEYFAPTPVLGDHRFTDLVAGGGSCHGETCGVTDQGTVLCWGKNYQRSTGPSSDISWMEPTPIMGDPGLVEVMVGPAMVCGFTQEEELYCLGNPLYGMLQATETLTPLVPELDVASLAMGATQTCVLTTDEEAFCWGSNSFGQLGRGDSQLGLGSRSPKGVWAPPSG